jgi:hypothetical protein
MPRKTLHAALLSVALLVGLSASAISGQGTKSQGTKGGEGGQVPLCHATGSSTNPFVLISPGDPSYNAHFAHGDVPAVNGVCGGTPSGVPEPITMLLFGAGLAGVGYAKRRMGRNKEA